MARLPRLTLAGQPHLVHQACVHGQPMALDDTDRSQLLAALRDAAAAHAVRIWAYVLLPQALQLVVCPATDAGLGRMMQALGRQYVQVFNRRHQRSGALWAGRFRAAVVEPGPWLLAALAQVDRVGLASAAWSSAPHHLGQRHDPLLTEPPEFWTLGNTPFERESAWQGRLDNPPDAEMEAALARAVHGTWAAGSPAFVARLAEAVGRPTAPRKAGRPPGTRRGS